MLAFIVDKCVIIKTSLSCLYTRLCRCRCNYDCRTTLYTWTCTCIMYTLDCSYRLVHTQHIQNAKRSFRLVIRKTFVWFSADRTAAPNMIGCWREVPYMYMYSVCLWRYALWLNQTYLPIYNFQSPALILFLKLTTVSPPNLAILLRLISLCWSHEHFVYVATNMAELLEYCYRGDH